MADQKTETSTSTKINQALYQKLDSVLRRVTPNRPSVYYDYNTKDTEVRANFDRINGDIKLKFSVGKRPGSLEVGEQTTINEYTIRKDGSVKMSAWIMQRTSSSRHKDGGVNDDLRFNTVSLPPPSKLNMEVINALASK